MNLFEEAMQDIESFGAEFDQTMDRLGVISEYNESTLSINQKRSFLREHTNEITLLEAVTLIEEAKEEAGAKTEKEIAVARKASKSYFAKVGEAIGNLANDKYTKALKKAENLCSANPALGKQKVEYKDYSQEAKEIEKTMAQMDKMLSRCLSKKECTKADAERAKTMIDETNKLRNRLKPKTTSISVDACLKMLKAAIDDMNDEVSKKKETKPYASKEAVKGMDSENGQRYSRIVQNRVRLDKEHSAVKMRMMSSMRDAIRHIGKGKDVKESVNNDSYMEAFADLPGSEFDPDFSVTDELEGIVESLQTEGTNMFDYNDNTDLFDESVDFEEDIVSDEDTDDIHRILQEAVEEVGIDLPYDDETLEESTEDEEDFADSILQEALLESGLDDDEEFGNSAESLLNDFEDFV